MTRALPPFGDNIDRLVAAGDLIDREAFMARLGLTHEQLVAAEEAWRFFHFDHAGQSWYPAFYADPTLSRPELERICMLLGDVPAGARWLFFTRPKGSLAPAPIGAPRTPLDALRAGAYDRVRNTAAAVGER